MPCIWYDLLTFIIWLFSKRKLQGRVTADATLDGCRNHGLRLGMADLGVATRTDTKEYADMIANSDPSKILIADMDTGYGGTTPPIFVILWYLAFKSDLCV